MNKIQILLCFIVIFHISLLSYGSEYDGTYNPITWNDESYGEGRTSWSEFQESINNRLNSELISLTSDMVDFYTYDNLNKELGYYYYVFSTNCCPYEEYKTFCTKLLDEYHKHNVGFFYSLKSQE